MASSGFRQTALSGARWTAAAKLGLQLFTWPVTIIVIRLLEPGDYGLLAMAMVTIGFVTLFSEMGLGIALVQARTLDDAMGRAACTAILSCNAVIAGALWLSAPLVADWFEEPDLTLVIQMLSLEPVISSLAIVPQAQLERQLRFKALSIASMTAGGIGSIATLTMALLGYGVWSLVVGNLILAAVRTVAIIVYNGRVVWPSLPRQLKSIRSLIGFSGHVVASRVLWYWYGQADQLILARLLHASLLGYYSVAAQLAMLPANKAMEVINRVSLPILSRLHAEDGSVRAMHQRLVGLVATYAFGTCWGLAAVAPEFVTVVLGAKWQPATLGLALLAIVAPLRMLSALNNTVTTAAGIPQASTAELACAGLVMPLAVLIGAMLDGLRGACIAWPVAYPVIFLLSNALTCKAIKTQQRRGLLPLLGPMIAASTMWLCIWTVRVRYATDIPTGWLLTVQIVVGAISYVAVLHAVALGLAQDARGLLRDLLNPQANVKTQVNEAIKH